MLKIPEDPRARRTRELLKQAMAGLLREKNLTSITVLDIARAAEVNRATFYTHFRDKHDLLNQCVRDWFRANLAEHVSPQVAFSPAGLRMLVMGVRQFLVKWNQPRCRSLANQIHPMVEFTTRDETFQFLEVWLPDEIAGPRRTVAEMLSWSIFGVALRLSQETGPDQVESLAREYLGLLERGIFQGAPLLS